MACEDNTVAFNVVKAKRRALGSMDLALDMKYCGICHTDIHLTRNDFGIAMYPLCPGHELVGVCTAVGSEVTKFQIGDHVGIGCFVDSCLECDQCIQGDEQYCRKSVVPGFPGHTATYGAPDFHGRAPVGSGGSGGQIGGYSSKMTVHEHFAIKIPASYPLEYAGPLMCAGITMYDPLKHYGVKKGMNVAIAGLGGLGQMGVKLAKAMGATVTVLSRTAAKKDYALTGLGADKFVAMDDAESQAAAAGSIDVILDTISCNHEVMPYIGMLALNGTHVLIGLAMDGGTFSPAGLLFQRKSVSGSLIGGIATTQEMVDLCAAQGIKPDIEVVGPEQVKEVFETLNSSNDKGVRYVLDCGKLAGAVGTKLEPADIPVH